MCEKPLRFFIAKHPCDDLPYVDDVDPDPRTGDTRFTFDGPDYSGWYVRQEVTEEMVERGWPKAMMRIGAFVHGRIGDMTSGELGDIAKEVTQAVLTAALFSSDAGQVVCEEKMSGQSIGDVEAALAEHDAMDGQCDLSLGVHVLIAAARAYLRLIGEGEKVWWCKWTRITDEGKLTGTLPGSAAWLDCFRSHGRATGHGSCGWAVFLVPAEEEKS
jgi:hypothetical protein